MCVIFDVTTAKRSWLAEASDYGQYFLARIFFLIKVCTSVWFFFFTYNATAHSID